jgi:hypothetical protein
LLLLIVAKNTLKPSISFSYTKENFFLRVAAKSPQLTTPQHQQKGITRNICDAENKTTNRCRKPLLQKTLQNQLPY